WGTRVGQSQACTPDFKSCVAQRLEIQCLELCRCHIQAFDGTPPELLDIFSAAHHFSARGQNTSVDCIYKIQRIDIPFSHDVLLECPVRLLNIRIDGGAHPISPLSETQLVCELITRSRLADDW